MSESEDDLTELDFMTDEEVMERVDTLRQMEAVRGLAIMGAQRWSEEDKLQAFMGIFHPGDDRLSS